MDPADLDRLERVRRWAAVPAASRNDEWVREFEGAFWAAPLCTFGPAELDTPDRHRFLRVSARTWKQGDDFTRPAMLVDRLIEGGLGLVLTDETDVTQVWLSLGEVLSYRLYGRAFARDENPLPATFHLQPGESIGLSPIHEAVFPQWARLNVRRHLTRTLGIAEPRAVWTILPGGSSALTFDLEVGRVGDEAQIQSAFRNLRWILPARIRFIRLDALSDAEEMRPF